jgi:H+-translocating NAD(P) transhydrogenase subunit alpha
MYVNVAVLKETLPYERRVALVPSVVPKLIKLGAKMHTQAGAGAAIKLEDAAFVDVAITADRRALAADADVVLAVQPPALDVIDGMKQGATHLGRVLPKIRTAADAIGPAKVLVMGLGVGAIFVKTGVDATGKGGSARELTPDEKTKVSAALTRHIQAADLIVTTAAIPGCPSPKLISKVQVAGMKAGAVIVDLSAEGGGNCEDTKPGETVEIGRVTVVAPLNVPSFLGEDASALYAKNHYNLLPLMMKDNIIKIDWGDDLSGVTIPQLLDLARQAWPA